MIKLNHDYHGVELKRPLSSNIREWLTEKLGHPNGDTWFIRHTTVYFANEKDHLMFLLKWG